MPLLLRQAVFVLLMLAQLALGSSAGDVLCLGGGRSGAGTGDGDCGLVSGEVGSTCSHGDARAEGLPLPVPVEPHDEDKDGCGCIDVIVPVARPDLGLSGDELLPESSLLAAATVARAIVLPPRCHRTPAVWLEQRPPGPAPGLRTTRLLI